MHTVAPAPHHIVLCKCRYRLCTPGYQILETKGQKFLIETKERIGAMGSGLAAGITTLLGGLKNLLY